jgi:hypothetical protein
LILKFFGPNRVELIAKAGSETTEMANRAPKRQKSFLGVVVIDVPWSFLPK